MAARVGSTLIEPLSSGASTSTQSSADGPAPARVSARWIRTHVRHVPQASTAVPAPARGCSQFSACASATAVANFPTPGGPAKISAGGSVSRADRTGDHGDKLSVANELLESHTAESAASYHSDFTR